MLSGRAVVVSYSEGEIARKTEGPIAITLVHGRGRVRF